MADHSTHPRTHAPPRPLRVLFLCTGNAARSQVAEALLGKKGAGRFEVASAGVAPVAEVHPMTVEALAEYGIDWSGRRPKGLEAVTGPHWDFVITVCDNAREACPTIPGHPVFAHWGVEDPAIVEDEDARWQAFRRAVQVTNRRVDLMLALLIEKLARHAREQRLKAIGQVARPDDDPFAVPEPVRDPRAQA